MEERQRELLRRNTMKLCQDLDLLPVIGYLKQEDVFRDHHQEEIESEKTKFGQVMKLLKLIQQRGPLAFNALHAALLGANQAHLADILAPALTPKGSNASGRESPSGRSRSPSPEALPPIRLDSRPGPEGLEDKKLIEETPLNPEAVAKAEKFYAPYIIHPVKQTCGVLEDLHVEAVDANFMSARRNDENVYQNFSQPKGLAIIFNNRRFRTLSERFGTDVDAKNMSFLLRQLGYVVKQKDNLSARDMKKAMVRFALKDEHKRCDSTVVVVLTHGQHGMFHGSDDELIGVEEFVSYLDAERCPELRGKPKIFFLQACRGDRYDGGKDSSDGGCSSKQTQDSEEDIYTPATPLQILDALQQKDKDYADAMSKIQKIPTLADTLIAYATTPGYVSWRNSVRGSWFIQGVCKIFEKHSATEDISSMLIRVNRYVAKAFESSDGQYKQIPEPCIRLTKLFYFFPTDRPA